MWGPISAQEKTQLPARLVSGAKSGGVVTDNNFPCSCKAVDNSFIKAIQFGFVVGQDDLPSWV